MDPGTILCLQLYPIPRRADDVFLTVWKASGFSIVAAVIDALGGVWPDPTSWYGTNNCQSSVDTSHLIKLEAEYHGLSSSCGDDMCSIFIPAATNAAYYPTNS